MLIRKFIVCIYILISHFEIQGQQIDKAVAYAREILDPSQQQLPDTVTNALQDALHAWDAGQREVTQSCLYQALQNSGDLPRSAISVAVDTHGEPLTSREREVLRLIASGLSNEEIAAQLTVGVSTIKKHINHMFSKLGVDSRTRAIVRAKEMNLL